MFLHSLLLPVVALLGGTAASPLAQHHEVGVQPRSTDVLQSLVTYDSLSYSIRGERLMIYSGEFHPFRLPVVGLWGDILQKIKALGYNTVSFYYNWALVEGDEGTLNQDGVFALKPFFAAAKDAGIYLIARPGPYIGGETSAGGTPGWLLRLNATLRTDVPAYMDATQRYVTAVGNQIAQAQITHGGPVILVQAENEYIDYPGDTDFPSTPAREYMAAVEQQWRDLGVVVPYTFNDPLQQGYWAAGTGLGAVDLYAINAYPLGFGCSDPYNWPADQLTTNWPTTHHSPNTPFSIAEFTGGSAIAWGTEPEQDCVDRTNEEANRIIYKNNYAAGAKMVNTYMIYGGTNWGNLGESNLDTSYDSGAAIREDRTLIREKYYEDKLQGHFIRASPAYLTSVPGAQTAGGYVDNDDITTTRLIDSTSSTNFYVVRHTDYSSEDTTTYHWTPSTSIGTLDVPLLGGELSLIGRDSKVLVTDYDVGGVNLLYSTSDILTWAGPNKKGKRVLVLYGGLGETHEFALPVANITGKSTNVVSRIAKRVNVLQWIVTEEAQTVTVGSLVVYLLWRNDAYNYWQTELTAAAPIGNFASRKKSTVVVKAGYLLREASISNNVLSLTGDVNATTDLLMIYEPTGAVTSVEYNGLTVATTQTAHKALQGTIAYEAPTYALPDFSKLTWKTINSLPEISNTYDDSLWTLCNHTTSTNPIVDLTTPVSLFGQDYGYHSGSHLYRGRFTASGKETTFTVTTAGGTAYGHTIWMNNTFVGSYVGTATDSSYEHTVTLPALTPGHSYVFTILIDHMGYSEEFGPTGQVQTPRGIYDYSFPSHVQSDITWKMTGNLGGEQYRDKARGPKNEGATWAERHGYHLPGPPSAKWASSNPITTGLTSAGVQLYTTTFDLNVPRAFDIPMTFAFENAAATAAQNYRLYFFVNGYQYGRWVSNLQRPDAVYPVPEGILNHNGTNTIAVILWALDAAGAKLGSMTITPGIAANSGYARPALSPMTSYSARKGVY